MKIHRYFGNNQLSLHKLQNLESIILDGRIIPTNRLVLVYQIHSAKIEIVHEKNCGAGIIAPPIHGFDGLITNQKNVFLCIKTADCIPVFLWDEQQKVVAALHSGRAGTEQNIAKKAVEIMTNEFQCSPENIRIELGPGICGNCYPVDRKTFNNFVQKTGIEQTFPYLDLKKVIISRLPEMGISETNIFDHKICTKEDSNYFSFRENHTTERQISIIGMT